MATYSGNTTLKVNRTITGATTVNANCYAIITYVPTSTNFSVANTSNDIKLSDDSLTRYFGPADSIPGTFTTTGMSLKFSAGTIHSYLITWTLLSGVEFINTP